MFYGSREAVWLKRLVQELIGAVGKPMSIFGDNQLAIALAQDDILNERTKHIEVKYHYIRTLVKK